MVLKLDPAPAAEAFWALQFVDEARPALYLAGPPPLFARLGIAGEDSTARPPAHQGLWLVGVPDDLGDTLSVVADAGFVAVWDAEVAGFPL